MEEGRPRQLSPPGKQVFFYFIWQEGENNLTSRLSLSSSPLPLRFTLLFFLLACFTIRGVFTSPFTSFGKIP